MAFDGSGVFNRLYNWQADAAAEIDIMADRMDAEFDGIATALSICLTRTGQAGMLANLGMGNFKITSLGAGTVAGDAVNKTQLDAAKTALDVLIASGFDGSTPTVLGTLKPTKMPLLFGNTEIANTQPQLKMSETDQADPLGRFRFRASAGIFLLERATTAAWATASTIFSYTPNIFTIVPPSQFSSTLIIAGALTMLGDVKIANTFPVLWLQDTSVGLAEPNWTLHSSSGTMRLGPADSAGVPRADYNIYMDVVQTQINSDTFRITSNTPRIWFEDVDGGDDYVLTLSAGSMRFYTASSVGALLTHLVRIDSAGLWIDTGDLSVDGDATLSGAVDVGSISAGEGDISGALIHITNGGYFRVGSYDNGTYGSGYGRIYWRENIRTMTVTAEDGGDTDFTITGQYNGSGAGITGMLASQITHNHGAVGTYRWLLGPNSGHSSGSSYSGSSLRTPHITVNIASGNLDADSYGDGPSGTWRAMQSGTAASGQMALGEFLRIS